MPRPERIRLSPLLFHSAFTMLRRALPTYVSVAEYPANIGGGSTSKLKLSSCDPIPFGVISKTRRGNYPSAAPAKMFRASTREKIKHGSL